LHHREFAEPARNIAAGFLFASLSPIGRRRATSGRRTPSFASHTRVVVRAFIADTVAGVRMRAGWRPSRTQ